MQHSQLKNSDPVTGGKRVYHIDEFVTFTVDAEYQLIKSIGFGAYGQVCSAVDKSTNQYVAIKKISKLFEDLVDTRRILREIKILQRLSHPNLISIKKIMKPLESQQTFKELYIVTELMETDLIALIRSKHAITEEHVRCFSFQLLKALQYLHSNGIIHRDLKPSNILINGTCELKVCDLGLARGGLRNAFIPTELTDYVVTRWYRAPEVILMCKYSAAIDIWAAGLVILELIARRPILPGKDYLTQLRCILELTGHPSHDDMGFCSGTEGAAFIEEVEPKYMGTLDLWMQSASSKLKEVIAACLKFNPDRRQTAAELLRHPYFEGLGDQDAGRTRCTEGNCIPFEWEFDHEDITEENIRAQMWLEMMRHHPQ